MSPGADGVRAPLTDGHGRVHTYLRVSVTDRCNFRCAYCVPAGPLSYMPREDLLTYEEIARIVAIFARMGVRRVRLTGGEPTVRRDIVELVRSIAATPGIDDLSMTTNGHALTTLAAPLARAGLSRVNVSLDTLDPVAFARITRGGDVARVLDGIAAARAAGLAPIKINAVIMADENDDAIEALAAYFLPHAADTVLRFIEVMPFEERRHRCVPSADIRSRLAARAPLVPAASKVGGGPSREWTWGEGTTPLRIGFISPLTEHFCASCNRLRLLADGHLRTCLAHEDTPSLRDALRGGADDTALEALVRTIVAGKPAGHEALAEGGRPFEGVMTGIGG